MVKSKNSMSEYIVCFVLGILFGILSKYLDTIAVNENWWTGVLHYFANIFTRLGIWIFIGTIIAAYSKTPIRAPINTILFFSGMLISYYLYSSYLFGFFPASYFIFWCGFALLSPLFAIIVWYAKNNEKLAFIFPAIPLGLLLSLSIAMGLFYMYISYIDELIMYILLCAVFYKGRKQLAITVTFSLVIAFIADVITPFHF